MALPHAVVLKDDKDNAKTSVSGALCCTENGSHAADACDSAHIRSLEGPVEEGDHTRTITEDTHVAGDEIRTHGEDGMPIVGRHAFAEFTGSALVARFEMPHDHREEGDESVTVISIPIGDSVIHDEVFH